MPQLLDPHPSIEDGIGSGGLEHGLGWQPSRLPAAAPGREMQAAKAQGRRQLVVEVQGLI
jgi:hypothetical protein